MNITEQEIMSHFPYPSFLHYQRNLLKRMAELWSSDIKVILLDAPTGAGKSGINTANALSFSRSFYATPQITLIDQILGDTYLGKYYADIKGRSHYECVKDEVHHTTVDCGMCTRIKDFVPEHCKKTVECPYWIDKMRCINSRNVLTDFAYLILEGASGEQEPPFLGTRDLCIYDESHQIDQHLIHLIGIKITPFYPSKNMYEKTHSMLEQIYNMDNLKAFLTLAKRMAEEEIKDYAPKQVSMMTWTTKLEYYVDLKPEQVKMRDRLREFVHNIDTFLESTIKDGVEWVWSIEWMTYTDITGKVTRAKILKVDPIRARFFAPSLVWNKADYFIVSSATLLDPEIFVSENGLDRKFKMDEIKHLQTPSVFPSENRPVVDMSIGSMRREDIEENLPRGVERIKEICILEMGENLEKLINIAVHVHSYKNAKEVRRLLVKDELFKPKIISHDFRDRHDKLAQWVNSRGNIFIAVGFEEGQNWIGDICSAMILFKVPFPDMSDKRVAKRLQLRHWNWYYSQTIMKTVQLYGRQVRTETDKKKLYIIDSSFWGLLRRRPATFPDWFKDAIAEEDRKKYGLKISGRDQKK